MEETKTIFRPSNCKRMFECSFSACLPQEEKPPKILSYLEERKKDHIRLSKGIFLDHECNCATKYKKIKERAVFDLTEELLKIKWGDYVFEGTPDYIAVKDLPNGYLVDILDWKTGKVIVEAADNKQLLCYAFLFYKSFKNIAQTFKLAPKPIIAYSLTIANTQSDKVLTEFETPVRIKEIGQMLHDNLNKFYVDKSYSLKEGSWCRFCPAKSFCPLKNRWE